MRIAVSTEWIYIKTLEQILLQSKCLIHVVHCCFYYCYGIIDVICQRKGRQIDPLEADAM